ncbi:phosphatidate cytidylyltransferase [Photobacterium sp. WH77]|uniref:phosphatidate cytidylyltransferase n=1 Tax=unclassified Photobacterium TaxID=2628852 RepID=UPI001EDC6A0A|nr:MULTISPECIES: phosphatidate cytidylyltransferase [unclassified Photobacterium]MCG2838804.1 phosphatidate cytidylyltransferase [Photobacterium sp. WH77]MCG2846421.1 phosphatidate cytidylyltransferase [Photobacterium sp. WH80]MDO6582755.1 phosphatidate cytidylyltransferase [Photobacterium sp. 2_MG-2023]
MLKQRILTALVLAPLVVAGIFLLPFSGFMLAIAGITLVGFWEWTQFVNTRSRLLAMVPPVLVLLASFLALPADAIELGNLQFPHHIMLAAGGVWWLFACLLVVTYPNQSGFWVGSTTLRYLFGLLTLIPFFWGVVMLRAVNYAEAPYLGAKLVMLVCLLVWAADSGAYFAGKRFGRHKMAPRVSPNKTLEGLAGGVVLAVVVAWATAELFGITFNNSGALLVTVVLTVIASVFGDLAESMLKRVSGIKDSGQILPGHGGILDRIDSLTAALPVFALLYLWLI